MNNQNLFEALINICGFTAIDDEMSAIKDAIFKDFILENVDNETEINMEKIKDRIISVNQKLFYLGYTPEQILQFWRDVKNEVKK